MEKVKKFDAELKEMYRYEFLINKILWVAFTVIGEILMMLPAEPFRISILLAAPSWMFLLGVHFYLRPYMFVTESGKAVSIYQKLAWMPVSKKEIWSVRKEYLNKYCRKVLVIAIILHLVGALVNHSVSIFDLLYPVGSVLIVWGICHINLMLSRFC